MTERVREDMDVEVRPEPCGTVSPAAYERLLPDGMLGEQTMSVRTVGTESGWSLLPAGGRAWRVP